MQWMQYEMAVAAGSHSVRAPCGHMLKLFETDVVQGWKLPGPAKHRFFFFVFLDSIGAVFMAKMCVAGGLADPGEDFAIG